MMCHRSYNLSGISSCQGELSPCAVTVVFFRHAAEVTWTDSSCSIPCWWPHVHMWDAESGHDLHAYPSNCPVGLLIPSVWDPGAARYSTGCATVDAVTHSAPDDNKQGDTIVSQEASGPAFEVEPRPGLSDRETGPQETHSQDEAPQTIDEAPVEVICCTTATHQALMRHIGPNKSWHVRFKGCWITGSSNSHPLMCS